MSATDRTPAGRFRPGQSGNPAGRPPGSRNKTTLAAEALLDGQVEKLTQRLINEALIGTPAALRLCFDRLAPRRKGRPAPFELSRPESIADAVEIATTIVSETAAGELTPQEAIDLFKVVEAFTRVRAIHDLEGRIARLERAVSGGPERTGETTGGAAKEVLDRNAQATLSGSSADPGAPERTDEFTDALGSRRARRPGACPGRIDA